MTVNQSKLESVVKVTGDLEEISFSRNSYSLTDEIIRRVAHKLSERLIEENAAELMAKVDIDKIIKAIQFNVVRNAVVPK